MCMGCMAQADFLATGGVLGLAGLRVGARSLFGKGRSAPKVSDAEADEFVAALQAHRPPALTSPTRPDVDDSMGPGVQERVPALTGPAPSHPSAPDG